MAIDISLPIRENRPSLMVESGRDKSFKPVSRDFMKDTPILAPKVGAQSEVYGGAGDNMAYMDAAKQLEVLTNLDAVGDYNPDRIASQASYEMPVPVQQNYKIMAASYNGDSLN